MEWSTLTWMEQVTWMAQVAQGVGTPIALLAIIVPLVALRRQSQTEGYAKLDEMYFQLQAIALQDPSITRPDGERDIAKAGQRYDLYAFMIWNFLETIHDRCGNDRTLWKTWLPIFQHEAMAHRDWFCSAGNCERFKKSFRKFVNDGAYKGQALPLRGVFSEVCL